MSSLYSYSAKFTCQWWIFAHDTGKERLCVYNLGVLYTKQTMTQMDRIHPQYFLSEGGGGGWGGRGGEGGRERMLI